MKNQRTDTKILHRETRAAKRRKPKEGTEEFLVETPRKSPLVCKYFFLEQLLEKIMRNCLSQKS